MKVKKKTGKLNKIQPKLLISERTAWRSFRRHQAESSMKEISQRNEAEFALRQEQRELKRVRR